MSGININITVPEMTVEEYAKNTGASLDTVRAWIKNGHVKSHLVGKRRMINVIQRVKECVEDGEA